MLKYIAIFQGRQTLVDAASLYEAKLKAIAELKVPESKLGLLSVMIMSVDSCPIVHSTSNC